MKFDNLIHNVSDLVLLFYPVSFDLVLLTNIFTLRNSMRERI